MFSVYQHNKVHFLKLEQVQTPNLFRHSVYSELNSFTKLLTSWRLDIGFPRCELICRLLQGRV